MARTEGGYWHRHGRSVSTLDVHVVRYVEERRRLHIEGAESSASTLSILLGFSDVFGDRPLSRLGPSDVRRWQISREHHRTSTRRDQFSRVRLFCRWMKRRGIIDRDIFDDDELRPPKPERSQPRALTREEIDQVLAVCPDTRARAIVWLMLGLALRCVSVHRLRIGDWDRLGEALLISGKGNKEKWLPIFGPPADALAAYLDEHPAQSGPLIRSYNQAWAPLSSGYLSDIVSAWMLAAGVKKAPGDGKTAHALRHTAAVQTIDETGDLRIAQELLDHARLSTTADVYGGRARLHQLAAAQRARFARYVNVDEEQPPAA